MRLRTFLFCFLPFASAASVQAAPLAGIGAGMDFHQVQSLRGEPVSTDTHEISRLVIWHYKKGDVVFKDGKTVIKAEYFGAGEVKRDRYQPYSFTGKNPKSKLTQDDVDAIISALPDDKGGTVSAAAPMAMDPGESSSN